MVSGEIFYHLGITLLETIFGFLIGAVLALVCGLWFALSPIASALSDPYIKALNAMPRVILAPIFALWFGLGIWSKVALGVTLVFFVVFFNVYQGIREVSPVVLANARMLGASKQQLLRTVYLPSATSWVFSSLHTSVGMAFVGAVVGEYLGSSAGVGYLILQAEGRVRRQHGVRGDCGVDDFGAASRRRGQRDRNAAAQVAAQLVRDLPHLYCESRPRSAHKGSLADLSTNPANVGFIAGNGRRCGFWITDNDRRDRHPFGWASKCFLSRSRVQITLREPDPATAQIDRACRQHQVFGRQRAILDDKCPFHDG